MKTISKFPRLLFCILMGMQLASCGLLEFDVDDIENEEVQDKISMLLNYDTVYALPGDTFALNPVYVDDKGQLQELNISGLLITSSNSEVVEVDYVKKTIKAVGVGECKVYVEPVAVLNNIINKKDSLMVYVFDLWEPTSRVFPYETVFYTKATVDGKELDTNDMSLFAFVPLPNFYSNNPFIGFECRAKGVPMNYHNKKGVMQLRVGADELGSEDDDDWDVEYEYETDEEGNLVLDGDGFPIIKRDENGNPIVVEAEDAIGVGNNSIIFRLYDKRTHQLYTSAKQVISDGETKGSLSKPYQLDFESYAYQQKKK